MKDFRHRFSIVVPCFNEAQFIGQTLQSLQNQTYSGSYEIVVVDNNCTDETVTIAQTFGVKVVIEPHPGVCWARQAGTKAARGEIVISTDADTLYPKEWLQTIDRTFQTYEDCVAVTGPCVYRDGPWWGKLYPTILFGSVSIMQRFIGRPFYVTATNIAFKKSAWTSYHTAMTQGGDELALLNDLKRQGNVIFNNANPVYTSGRRLTKGLFYNFFITFLTYYLIAYVANKLFKRRVIGTAPAFRIINPAHRRWIQIYGFVVAILIVSIIHLPKSDTMLQQSYETISELMKTYTSKTRIVFSASEHYYQPDNKIEVAVRPVA